MIVRELKFRAWLKDEKRMAKVHEVSFFDDKVFTIATIDNFYADDEFKLMQFTGLKDKNGKEVFEGDIIKDSEDFIAQVVYDKEYTGFGLNYQPFDLVGGLSVTFEELENEYRNTFEVIGNIYENPELLGGK